MKDRTINQSIIDVLTKNGRPSSINEIYDQIIQNNYYQFRAERPRDIVRSTLRRHCINLDFPTASDRKFYRIYSDGKYFLKDNLISLNDSLSEGASNTLPIRKDLIDLHTRHLGEFKSLMLENLKNIKPDVFEHFCKKLLEVYGFKDLLVTNVRKDGGIDGYGKLKVGISYLNVAFQSKRWKNSIVGRTEIDKFRGAIQGDFEQGIFITTSSFSKDALKATTKKGAVPVILIDGSMIIDIMIEKKFGVQIEELPVYINALDEILTE